MRRLIAGTAVLVLAAMAVIAVQVQFDWLGSSLTVIARHDPTLEGMHWTSIRDDLAARGLLRPGALVAAVNWRDAGKIGHALGPDATMLCLNADARQFGIADPLRAFAGRDVVVLVLGPAEQAARWFRSIQVLPATSVRLDGRVLAPVTVVRGEGLLP